jgi:hypothetical protein
LFVQAAMAAPAVAKRTLIPTPIQSLSENIIDPSAGKIPDLVPAERPSHGAVRVLAPRLTSSGRCPAGKRITSHGRVAAAYS